MDSNISMQESFKKQNIRIGTITVSIAIIANFIPALYLWFVKGIMLDFDKIVTIWAVGFATYGIQWFVQPISYFTTLGEAGSYIGWVCGSVADIRLPAANMAQKAANVEPGTPEGDVISTLGITSSVFLSVTIITIFTVIGSQVLPMLPQPILNSFKYILPSLFTALFVNTAAKNLRLGVCVFVIAVFVLYFIRFVSIPSSLSIFVIVIASMAAARVLFVFDKRKK